MAQQIVADLVSESSTTTGIGDVSLAGALPGNRTFSSVCANGDTVFYSIKNGSEYEVGRGSFNSTGPALVRTTVFLSSNSNNLVSLSAGTKTVELVHPATQILSEGFAGSDNAGGATITMGSGDSFNLITSTTAITAFAFTNDWPGRKSVIRFNTIRTLTHNGTSLIIPGSANITTAVGDIAFIESLGSGNFRVNFYSRADGSPGVLPSIADDTFLANISGGSAAPTATALSTLAGDGLQGGANAVLNIDVSDFVGSGLEDDGAENIRIAASAAGAGLTGGAGSALAVGAGTHITVNADDVAVNTTTLLAAIDSTSVVVNSGTLETAAVSGAIAIAQNGTTSKFAGILDNGAAETDRTNLNFVSGTNTTATVTDDAGNDELEIRFNVDDLPLTALADQAAETFNGNFTAGSAAPTARAGSSVAGAGLTYTAGGTLAVGAGTHITSNANDVAVDVTTLLAAIDSTSVVVSSSTLQTAAVTGAIAIAQNGVTSLFSGIKDNGSAETDRTNLNFVNSTSMTAVVTDDAGNDELEITYQRAAITGVVAIGANANTSTFDASAAATTSFAGVSELATTTETITGTDTVRSITPDALAALWEAGTDNTGGATITLGEGGSFNLITSTTAITAFAFTTDKAGRCAIIRFNTVRTLTHNGTSLILPTSANITTAVGDICQVQSLGSGNFRVNFYQRADGTALASSGGLSAIADGTFLANISGGSAAPTATALTTLAGAGLTGGADAILAVGAGNGITVNANDVAVADASATQVLTGTAANVVATPNSIAALWESGGQNSDGATITLGEGGTFELITSTTAITSIVFATDRAGRTAVLNFSTVRTLTHSAALQLPTSANITTAIGDTCEVCSLSGGNARVNWYQRKNGQALVDSPITGAVAGTLGVTKFAGIQNATAATTDRTNLNFTGFTVADNSGNDSIDITAKPVRLDDEFTDSRTGAFDLTAANIAAGPAPAANVTRLTFTGAAPTLNSVEGGTDTGRTYLCYYNGSGSMTVKHSTAGASGNESRMFNPGNGDFVIGPRQGFWLTANGTLGWRTYLLTPTSVRKNSTGTVFNRPQINLIEGSGVTLTVSDDSSNNEVDVTIASSSASSATTSAEGIVELATDAETITGTDTSRAVTPSSLAEAITSLDVFQFYDEFTSSSVSLPMWTDSQSGSSVLTKTNGSLDHPGILTITTGTTSGNRKRIHFGTTVLGQSFNPTRMQTFSWLVRFPAITTLRGRFGLMEDATGGGAGTIGLAGAVFEFDPAVSANWQYITRQGGTSTTNNSVAVSAGSWYLLEAIRNSSGNWEFYVNKTLRFTHSTNLPTTTCTFGAVVETTAGSARSADVDAASLRYLFGQRYT